MLVSGWISSLRMPALDQCLFMQCLFGLYTTKIINFSMMRITLIKLQDPYLIKCVISIDKKTLLKRLHIFFPWLSLNLSRKMNFSEKQRAAKSLGWEQGPEIFL